MKRFLAGVLVVLLVCAGAVGAWAQEASAPQRIVVLPVWASEMLLEMIGPERIVGLSAWGDNAVLSATSELAKQVEGRVASNNVEGILMLAPDLVIIDSFSDFDGSLGEMLQGAGVTCLRAESPMDLQSVMSSLTLLGEQVGAADKAEHMRQTMQATLADVAVKVAQIPAEQRVHAMFYEDYYDPNGTSAGMLCAYGPGSTFDAICAAAGVINVCTAENYSPVSKEKIVAEWKPELLIVPGIRYDASFTPIEDGGQSIREGILADVILADLPAVKQQRVAALTESYRGSTSQYMAQAVVELAKLAYPELCQ